MTKGEKNNRLGDEANEKKGNGALLYLWAHNKRSDFACSCRRKKKKNEILTKEKNKTCGVGDNLVGYHGQPAGEH